jgi:hypothetical protein
MQGRLRTFSWLCPKLGRWKWEADITPGFGLFVDRLVGRSILPNGIGATPLLMAIFGHSYPDHDVSA